MSWEDIKQSGIRGIITWNVILLVTCREREYLFCKVTPANIPLLTKTQAGNELSSTVGHSTVWVERFQKVGSKHQRHHIL